MGGSGGGVRTGGGGMGIVIGGVGCIPGETSTLQSDSTHLTILPAEQAQLAALTESDDNDSEDDSEMDGRVGSRGEDDDEYYYGGGGAHSSSEAVLRPVPSSRSVRHEHRHSGRQHHSPSVGFGIPRPFR